MRFFSYRSFFRASLVALYFVAMSIFAQDSTAHWFDPLSGEYVIEETYVGEADVRRDHRVVRDFDESNSILRFIFTPRAKLGVLRVGGEWERFSFGFPELTALPNTLQSVDLVAGIDTQFSDSILVRFEAEPGVYGTNHLTADTFNVPFIVGGTYIYNSNVQCVLGVSVDVERKYPVLPGAGLRWRLHRQWVLNAVLPKPRLEYDPTKDLELYVGANIKETSFRVDDAFGQSHGIPKLNNAVLTYSEVRTGVGFDWKISSIATLTAEAGYQPYRTFDFYRADVRYHENGSAPYGMISLHGAF